MSEVDSKSEMINGMRNLYFLGDGFKIYNSLGHELTYDSLPESETLEQDRIIIGKRCIGYRVFRFDNLNSTDVLPTQEIRALPAWQPRVVRGDEYIPQGTYFNCKGDRIDEPSSYTKIKEIDIPWFEKEYDKFGRCLGYRVYNTFGGIKICYFNHYILEREAGEIYKKELNREQKKAAKEAKMPMKFVDPKTGVSYWLNKETGELTEIKT